MKNLDVKRILTILSTTAALITAIVGVLEVVDGMLPSPPQDKIEGGT